LIGDVLAVGGMGGVYAADATVAGTPNVVPLWSLLGTGMPNAIVMDLTADPKAGLLFAGTLGRGNWVLSFAAPAQITQHYKCYETPAELFTAIAGISLNDQFGSSTITARRRKRFCNPSVKNCEDPSAPLELEHLSGYQIKQTSPTFVPISSVNVANQFGSVVVDLVKPDYLLVPSAKSLTGPPAPLVNPATDHFKCYRVRSAKTQVLGLVLTDQFGTLTYDVKKPLRLCVAADKNFEGVPDPSAALLCYKGRQVSLPTFRGITPIYINDQFGAVTTSVDHLREFCVPSLVQ
jgi:hypothetical protein